MTLAGLTVVLTRRAEQAGALTDALRAQGADVRLLPLIAIGPPEDPRPLHDALARAAAFDWIVFTSANAVEAVAGARALPARIASVGPATSRAVRSVLENASVALEPASDFRAEGLLAAFEGHDVRGARILLPQSDHARPTLAEGLRDAGALVTAVTAYRTVPSADAAASAAALLAGAHVVVYASPSAVDHGIDLCGDRLRVLPAAVIGPVTERAARDAGLDVAVVARPSTTDGLLQQLGAWAASRRTTNP